MPIQHKPLISAKEAWETKKAQLEVKKLQMKWALKAPFWSIVLPFIIGLLIVGVTYFSGILDSKAAINENKAIKLQMDINRFEERKNVLADSITYLKVSKDSMSKIIRNKEAEIRAVNSAYENALNDTRGLDKKLAGNLLKQIELRKQIVLANSDIGILKKENDQVKLQRDSLKWITNQYANRNSAAEHFRDRSFQLQQELDDCKAGRGIYQKP